MEIKKKKIRLIGLDLDGTVLTSDKRITEHTREIFRRCISHGIYIVPATGRARSAIPEYLNTIDGIRYMITSNGGSVIDRESNEVIYENGIAWERALELLDDLEAYDTYYDIYTMGRGWCEARFYDHLEKYNIEYHIEKMIRSSRSRIDDLRAFLKEQKTPVEKINMFFINEEEKLKAFEVMKDIPDLAITHSLGNNLEINHHTCNKGSALLGLGEKLSIPPEEIMACGDGLNDLAMIQMAGVGVAMENGYDILKENCNFITKTNDQDGVAYAIESLCIF